MSFKKYAERPYSKKKQNAKRMQESYLREQKKIINFYLPSDVRIKNG